MTDHREDAAPLPSAEFIGQEGLTVAAEGRSVRMGSGTAWAIGAQIVATLSSLVVGIMVSRALGPTGKGLLVLILGVVGTMLVLADLGVGTASVYFVSKGEIKPGVVLGNSMVLLAGVSVVCAGVMAVLFRSPLAVVHLSWQMTGWAYILFVTSMALSWLSAIAMGVGGVRGQALPGVVSRVAMLVVVAVAWTVGTRSVGLVVVASVVGSLAGIVSARRLLGESVHPVATSRRAFAKMAAYSSKLYVASAADFLHFRQDVLMLGWMVGPTAVGVYSVGVSLGEVATRVPLAVANAIQAQLSRVGHDSALDVASRVMRLCAAFALLSIAVLALFAGWFVPFVFGPGFAGSVNVFYLLSPGVLAAALIWPISSYQTARGIVYWRESVVSGVLNVAINLALIPRWGYLGATVASSVSYSAWFALLFWHLCRDTGQAPAKFLVFTGEDVRIVIASTRSYLHRGSDE